MVKSNGFMDFFLSLSVLVIFIFHLLILCVFYRFRFVIPKKMTPILTNVKVKKKFPSWISTSVIYIYLSIKEIGVVVNIYCSVLWFLNDVECKCVHVRECVLNTECMSRCGTSMCVCVCVHFIFILCTAFRWINIDPIVPR